MNLEKISKSIHLDLMRLKSPLDSHNKFDERVKTTIVFIIQEFFKKNPDSALLYVCMFNDGKAENRHIIFSRWFNESGNNFEKFDSPLTFRQQEFYSSLILLSSNVQKHFLKKAFVLTLNYWMREE